LPCLSAPEFGAKVALKKNRGNLYYFTHFIAHFWEYSNIFLKNFV